jgi:excisionase family DNA binding protein
MQQQEPTPLLSITEFAARLRVTSACVRRWLLERKIAQVKLGRLVRIPAAEVDRLISEGLRPRRDDKSVPASLQPLFDKALKARDLPRLEPDTAPMKGRTK